MGRHRSTLRDLGWSTSNSPNPWKNGSAKRVVRALDYGSIDIEEPQTAEQQPIVDHRDAQADAAGRAHLDCIREQFEAEDTENKRKLDRLNGRIAELGEGKRALWGILSMQPKANKPTEPATAEPATSMQPRQGPAAEASAPVEARSRQDVVTSADAALSEIKLVDALASREADLARREAAVRKAEDEAEERAVQKEAAATQMMAAVTRDQAELRETKDAVHAALAAREAKLAEAEAVLAEDRARLREQEAQLAATHAAIADQQQLFVAAAASVAAAAAAPVGQKPAASTLNVKPAPALVRMPESKVAAVEVAPTIKAESKPKLVMPWSSSKPAKAVEAKAVEAKAAQSNELQIDKTADWARSDNLFKTLAEQSADPSSDPDAIFCPLNEQQTCKLSDIFSAPQNRERNPGSGEWTPMSVHSGQTPAVAVGQVRMQLVGVDGEYAGETLPLPLDAGATGTFLIGRSSSCEVTLARDDQISRRHAEVEVRDGKVFIRDLNSTYGTKLNGAAIGDTPVQVRPGDVLSIGCSGLRLQFC